MRQQQQQPIIYIYCYIVYCEYILAFKETKWFFMNAESSLLKPQIEEGISDVKWISFDKIHTLVMFESVKDPIIFFVG